MKVTSINNYIKRHPNSNSLFRGEVKCEEQMYKSMLCKYDQGANVFKGGLQDKSVNKSVNKTADLKSSGFFSLKKAPSFSGAAPQQYGKILTAFADSKKAHKVLQFIDSNKAVYEAITAFVVAGLIRPATIIALPTKDYDKEKNKKAAAHSISSGLMGLASTAILFQPITSAVSKITKNAEKYGFNDKHPMMKSISFVLHGDTKTASRLEAYKDFMRYAPKILFCPITAAATIALMPLIDKYIFGKVLSPKVVATEETPYEAYKSMGFKGSIDKNNKTFKSFMGGKC